MTRRNNLWLFVCGFLMPFLTGFLGLMPLDQSVIFEAGGRIARGEVPFRDISFPYGLVPALIQAVIFKTAGVSWFSYVLHAALINGLFAVVTADILRLILPRARKIVIISGALLAAWAFYPMTGTPFMDNHSLFFSVVAWWASLAAFRRKKYYLFIACFAALAAGFYSKPIPVAFWIFPILVECLVHRSQLKWALPWIAGGIATGLCLMALPLLLFPADQFIYYAYTLPFGIGRSRIGGSFVTRFVSSIRYFKILVICIIPLCIYFFIGRKESSGRWHITRFVVIVLITIVTGVLTKNSFYNFTSPVFIIVFTVFVEILSQHITMRGSRRLFLALSFLLWLLIVAGVSVLNFRREIDIRFSVKDLNNYSQTLGFFVKTPLHRHSKADLEKLKGYISTNNALYTGDSQFLFSLSGKKNPLPVTHLNDGTTYNSTDSLHYRKLKEKLVNNIIAYKSNLLITDITWNENHDLITFADRFRGEQIDSFGLIKVYRLIQPQMPPATSMKRPVE